MTFSTKPLTPIPFGIAFSLKVGFLGGLVVKNPSANAGDKEVQSLDRENPLEEEMATHSRILAWKISWIGEPGGLQPMGCKESDRLTHIHTDTHKMG